MDRLVVKCDWVGRVAVDAVKRQQRAVDGHVRGRTLARSLFRPHDVNPKVTVDPVLLVGRGGIAVDFLMDFADPAGQRFPAVKVNQHAEPVGIIPVKALPLSDIPVEHTCDVDQKLISPLKSEKLIHKFEPAHVHQHKGVIHRRL